MDSTALGGLTRSAVIAKMHRLGLGNTRERKKPPPPPKLRAKRKVAKPDKCEIVWHRRWSFKRPGARQPQPPRVRTEDIARIAHDDLKSRHCRWPVGNVKRAIAQHRPLFCGKRREPGLPYCAEHVACAYRAIALIPRHYYPTGEKGGAASAKSSV